MTPDPHRQHELPHGDCEAHSVAIAVAVARLEKMEADISNYRAWRIAVENKLDGIRQSIHVLELRLYLVIGGIASIAWAYEHWFKVAR